MSPQSNEKHGNPVEMLEHWARAQGDRVFLRQPRGGVYDDLTWSQGLDRVERIAGGLRAMGFEPGDRIALLSKNCAEWFLVDLALMLGGYVSVPIYPSANADTINYVLEHSEAKAMFVGELACDEEQSAIIDRRVPRIALPYETPPAETSWEQMLELGEPLKERIELAPDRVLTIIYTSGSTGRPKGVIHTTASLTWVGHAVRRHLGVGTEDRVISYLPLAHITERAYIELGSIAAGGTIGFVENRDSFIADVARAAPTLFISVPRLWTLFRENILARGGAKLELMLRIPFLRRVVQRKIRAGLGLSHARVLGCGSAPVSRSLLAWYHRAGMPITEAWGMTENSAYATLNYPFRLDKLGTVGRVCLDSEVKASERGELLFRGPGLMQGYYKNPEATAEALTDDGYLRTGDRCTIDDDGYVTITGRVKDDFKTAKGKYVSPAPIENRVAANPYVEQCCVLGAGLPSPVVLIQLTEAAADVDQETVRSSLEGTRETINTHLESHARIGGLFIVAEGWTTDNDALTPTLKVRRHVLEDRFGPLIAELDRAEVRWEAH